MTTVGFPLNLVDAVAARLQAMDGLSSDVLKRPMRLSDPAISLAVHAVDWSPGERQQIGQLEPTAATYVLRVQNMVRHSNEEEGRALYTQIAKSVRVILYRDTLLQSQLGGMSETLMGTIERVQRFGVRNQRFLNNEFRGSMVYLASTDFYVECEITRL